MKIFALLRSGWVLALLVCLAQTGWAEEPKQTGSVYNVAFYTVKSGQLDEFLTLREKAQPMVSQNRYVKSRKTFQHAWGPEWSVMVVTEYASLADIEKASARTRELYEKAYSKDQRDQWNDRYHDLLISHSDAIVRDVPALAK